MIEEIEKKLFELKLFYEKNKLKTTENNADLIERYFKKIERGILNLKTTEFSNSYKKEGEITSIKIYMNKIYDIIKER